jgi:CheY-like chemotaxis protein
VAARVCEPFFTTKPQGQGTGLGLSQVHGFVKQSGGHVAIDTRPGEGTTVSIYMPRHRAAAVPSAAAEEAACDSGTAGVVVLAVEDDAEVRRTSVAALRELGHVVLEAETPGAALRLLEAERFDVLITDLSMPAMPGLELAQRATQLRPTLRVIFASGHEMPAVQALPFRWGALRKPYSIDELDAMLRGFDE